MAHAVRNSPINADKFDLIENSSLMEKNDKVFNLHITIGYIFKYTGSNALIIHLFLSAIWNGIHQRKTFNII